jgi:hypothetical protein
MALGLVLVPRVVVRQRQDVRDAEVEDVEKH